MPTFGDEEIAEAIESLLSQNVTMGKKVNTFESNFSAYIGCKYSAMVNSGSSANLLALSILSNPLVKGRIMPGDEVIVPAVTWSTSVFPIINIGAKPVLVDVDRDYLIDIEKLKESITPKTRAIMAVHLLGNVCDMKALQDIAKDRKLFLMEDTCEALGSEFSGKKAGALSDISSFSTYFSHHMTTMEGGVVCTDDFEYADLSRILRAHGYSRHSLRRQEYEEKNPEIDPRFLFVNMGYNFRPMEIQGAFGIHQLKKLDSFLEKRRHVAQKLLNLLEPYSNSLLLPREKPNTRHSWFSFGLTVKESSGFKRGDLMRFLEKNGIETRPIVGGNLAEQPAMRLFQHSYGNLSNSENVMKNGFYIGIHPGISDNTVDAIGAIFDSFFATVKK